MVLGPTLLKGLNINEIYQVKIEISDILKFLDKFYGKKQEAIF